MERGNSIGGGRVGVGGRRVGVREVSSERLRISLGSAKNRVHCYSSWSTQKLIIMREITMQISQCKYVCLGEVQMIMQLFNDAAI